MIGYHCTTLDAWESIQREGLQLYPIRKDYLPGGLVWGIWVWRDRPDPDDEWHFASWQVLTKYVRDVAFLEVEFPDDARLAGPRGCYFIHHDFSMDDVTQQCRKRFMHRDHMAYIVTRPIEPENVRLLSVWSVRRREVEAPCTSS